jgi:hypothetical protein
MRGVSVRNPHLQEKRRGPHILKLIVNRSKNAETLIAIAIASKQVDQLRGGD